MQQDQDPQKPTLHQESWGKERGPVGGASGRNTTGRIQRVTEPGCKPGTRKLLVNVVLSGLNRRHLILPKLLSTSAVSACVGVKRSLRPPHAVPLSSCHHDVLGADQDGRVTTCHTDSTSIPSCLDCFWHHVHAPSPRASEAVKCQHERCSGEAEVC